MLCLKWLLSPGTPCVTLKGKMLSVQPGATCVLTCGFPNHCLLATHRLTQETSPLLPTPNPVSSGPRCLISSQGELGVLSGARDPQSPDLQSQPALQKLLEYGGSSLHQQAAVLRKLLMKSPRFGNSIGGSYLELANTVSPFWFREHIFRPGWMPICIFEFWAPEDISGIVSFYWAKHCTISSIANNVKCSKCLWLVTSLVLLRAEWLVKKCFKSVPCTDLISSISTMASP